MAKIALPSLADLQMLTVVYQATVSDEHLDAMGHMNIRHYLAMFDSAAWVFFESLGLGLAYYKQNTVGMFALEQHLRYVREVHAGESIHIGFRLVAMHPKRLHFMGFMVNDTQPALAAVFESLGSHADLTTRRTAPFPEWLYAQLVTRWQQDEQLGWAPPLCGSIQIG